MPWYAKLFLALGGTGLIWKTVDAGVPEATDWLKSWVVHMVAAVCAAVFAHPSARALAVRYRSRLLPLLQQLRDALVSIIQAAEAEVEHDLPS